MVVATPAAGAGLDLKFIALALGVVALSAGGAFAFTLLGGPPAIKARPIDVIVASESNRDRVKQALAREAFTDKDGAALMTLLATEFPAEHDKLLGELADNAMRGGDRDTLAIEVNQWMVDFTPRNLDAIGRTGAKGFDMALDAGSEGLDLLEKTAGGCNLPQFEKTLSDPQKFLAAIGYGSEGYAYNMRTTRRMVELAAAGRNMPQPDATLRPQDEAALQSVVVSLMADRDFQSIMKVSMNATSSGANLSARELATTLNICDVGHKLIDKFDTLPLGTKERIWALGAKELRRMMATGTPPSALMAPGQLSMR